MPENEDGVTGPAVAEPLQTVGDAFEAAELETALAELTGSKLRETDVETTPAEQPGKPSDADPESKPPEPSDEDEGKKDEPKAEDDKPLESEELSPKAQANLERRIGQEARKTRVAKEETEALRSDVTRIQRELDESKRARTPPPASATAEFGDLAGCETDAEIDAKCQTAWGAKRWAERNPDGGTAPDGKGNDIEFNADRVSEIRNNAEDTIHQHAPRRRKFLQEQAHFSRVADSEFPWLKDKSTDEYRQFEAVLAQDPSIRAGAGWKLKAAVFVKGLQAIAAEKAANGKPKAPADPRPTKPPPRQPTAPAAAAPVKPASSDDEVKRLRRRAMESGDEEHVAAYLEQAHMD